MKIKFCFLFLDNNVSSPVKIQVAILSYDQKNQLFMSFVNLSQQKIFGWNKITKINNKSLYKTALKFCHLLYKNLKIMFISIHKIGCDKKSFLIQNTIQTFFKALK